MEMEFGKVYHVPNSFAQEIQFSDFNRDISYAHVKKLTDSMRAEGFRPCCEIQIDKNKKVIDGHHRLEAVRKSGVDFDVVMYDIEASPKLIQELNSDSKAWDNLDTISSLSKAGSPVHQRCVMLLNAYIATKKLSSSALMFACTGKLTAKDITPMAAKDFKLMVPYKKISSILDMVIRILGDLPVKRCVPLEKALILCVRCSGISTIRLKNQCSKYGERLKKPTSVQDAIGQLEAIYNFRAKKEDAVDFFELTGLTRE